MSAAVGQPSIESSNLAPVMNSKVIQTNKYLHARICINLELKMIANTKTKLKIKRGIGKFTCRSLRV